MNFDFSEAQKLLQQTTREAFFTDRRVPNSDRLDLTGNGWACSGCLPSRGSIRTSRSRASPWGAGNGNEEGRPCDS